MRSRIVRRRLPESWGYICVARPDIHSFEGTVDHVSWPPVGKPPVPLRPSSPVWSATDQQGEGFAPAARFARSARYRDGAAKGYNAPPVRSVAFIVHDGPARDTPYQRTM
jgi:hypothetical protein